MNSKHYATRMAYVRETIKAGAINIQYVPSGENRAVICTKDLGKTKTLHHLARLTATRGYEDLQFASQGMSKLLIEKESARE